MPQLEDLQRDFAAALLDASAAVPQKLVRQTPGAPVRRFAVYRNNVYSSLIEVLQGRFPVVARLVGEEFFRAMARVYIERDPPASAVLLLYGKGFPDFVASFGPAASVPYLGDIAALEWAWQAAYHARDAAPLSIDGLAGAIDDAESAVLELHPSLSLVRSAYPIVSIYELHADESEVPSTKLDAGAEDAMVLRPHLDVEIRRLPPGAYAFIGALQRGRTIGEALALALEAAPDFDLTASLAGLMTSGAIVGVGY